MEGVCSPLMIEDVRGLLRKTEPCEAGRCTWARESSYSAIDGGDGGKNH